MARAKKEAALTPEERLQAALVPDWEWPYKLPENWCWVRLYSLAHIISKGTTPKGGKDAYVEKGIRFLRIENINEDGSISHENIKHITEEMHTGFLRRSILCKDDILISIAGTLGKTGIVGEADLPLNTNQAISFVRLIRGNLLPQYIKMSIDNPKTQDMLISQTKVTSIPNLTLEIIGNCAIPLAPLAEQQRIVDRIESLFSKLDEAKEKAQAVVDSFETHKAAILHKAFTGELTAKWREEHYATDNTVLMDIKNYSSSWSAKEKDLLSREQAKSEVVVLDNGHEWIRCTIGAVGRVTNGSTPLRKEPKYWSGKIPWISSGEVRNNIIESSNECISEEGYANSSVKLLPIGTVLIAMIGEGKTRGQSAILNIEATINQNVAAIVVEHNCVLPYYIWYWLQMNYAKNREKGSGSGPQALNCQRVRELDFFVPNLREQKEVVNILRKALAKEQQSKEAAEAALGQIDLMKKSILSRAFRGELGTNDPSEESAVELLKQVIEQEEGNANRPKAKAKRISIPTEIKPLLSGANEEAIVKLLLKAAPQPVSAQTVMSISKKKFELMDALRNLEKKQIVLKSDSGEYSLVR